VTRRLVGIGVAAVILVSLAVVALHSGDLLGTLRNVSPEMLGALVVVGVVLHLAQAWQFGIVSRALGYPVAAGEAVGLTAVNTAANYAIPVRGGAAARAAYMRAVHDMPVSRYAMVMTSLLGVSLVVAAAAGLLVGTMPGVRTDGAVELVFGIVLVAGSLAAAVLVVVRERWKGPRWLRRIGEALSAGIDAWLAAPGHMWRFAASGLIVFGIGAGKLWLAFTAVGTPIAPAGAVVLQAAATLAFLVSLTPGNLGVREGIVVAVATGLGLDVDVALAAVLVDRLTEMVATFLIAVVFSRALMRSAGDTATNVERRVIS